MAGKSSEAETLPSRSASSKGLQRKLTEIPETNAPVTCRVQFLLLGEGARDFAGFVTTTEMAESYHGRQQHEVAEGKDGLSTTSTLSERFLLFCPRVDREEGFGAELARIELTPIVGFGDSLPLTRQFNENIHVVFLCWQPEGATLDTSALTSEFMRRLAEIRFLPKGARPPLTLLMVNCNEKQREVVESLMAKQKEMDEPLTIAQKLAESNSEDDVITALQLICRDTVAFKPNVRYTLSMKDEGSQGGCCSLM
ncbi:hypothetical protein AK812_SmicGene1542 [Symbiodinium microadriaticum]|uniref:Uncharacterized protein n=1 Tax=Symbiodinium microadriaticum TaxID=2951 RepID=A0A1Q9F3X1_SYMMI|nr:hypothetical protein AK812_SmicGene1542 [Symbiodinium microadriaticum]|mmetsp:Transcript_55383/g.132295  ORF Transcript_55383/g.132295 Transcript_55383/m.132295 type:complete len:254 (+) Transcript_55383:59-820(+)